MIILASGQASPEAPISLDWWNTVDKVTHPFALIAFFVSAGLSALLMILRFTGGLRLAQEYLLRNAQLTGAQFESIIKFITLAATSFAICLLVFLGFKGWIDKPASPTASAPHIKIAFPDENQNIEVSSKFPQVTLRGVSGNIPQNEKIWVFAFPLEASRFFPFQSSVTIASDGGWTSNGIIGPIDRPDTKYDFFVVGADENARYAIDEYLKNQVKTKQYLGFESLPDHSNVYSRREVTFTPESNSRPG